MVFKQYHLQRCYLLQNPNYNISFAVCIQLNSFIQTYGVANVMCAAQQICTPRYDLSPRSLHLQTTRIVIRMCGGGTRQAKLFECTVCKDILWSSFINDDAVIYFVFLATDICKYYQCLPSAKCMAVFDTIQLSSQHQFCIWQITIYIYVDCRHFINLLKICQRLDKRLIEACIQPSQVYRQPNKMMWVIIVYKCTRPVHFCHLYFV